MNLDVEPLGGETRIRLRLRRFQKIKFPNGSIWLSLYHPFAVTVFFRLCSKVARLYRS